MSFTLMLAAAAAVQQPASPDAMLTRDRLDRKPPAAPVARPAAKGKVSIALAGNGKPIEGIAFRGASAPAEVARAAEKFVGRPATKEVLIELAGALSRAYEKTDVALYTVAIPEQAFEDNVVVVSLTEGWIESAKVNSNGGQSLGLLQRQAQRMVGEKPLRRRTMERQVSLMRAIPGLKLETNFDNADGNESVELVVDARHRRVEVVTGIGNRGPDLVGDLVVDARASLFSIAGQGDQLSLTASGTPDFRRYRQVGLSYARPIGVDGLTISASAAAVRTRVRAFGTTIEGKARLAALTLNYPLIREFKRAADLSLGIDGVNSDNAAFGNIIATERTRAVRAAGSYVASDERSTLSASGIVSLGIDAFGARVVAPLADKRFRKLTLNGGYERKFGTRLFGRLNATAQYSPDRLPGAELFSAGGARIGRAFDTGLLTGDSGAGGLAELAYRPVAADQFKTSELYAFADSTWLKINRRGLAPAQDFGLASAGIGGRLRFKDKVELGLEGAKVIDRPYPAYRDDWRLSFYYSLSL